MSDGLPLHLQYMAESMSAKKKKLRTRKERDKLQTQRSASFREERRTSKLDKIHVKLLIIAKSYILLLKKSLQDTSTALNSGKREKTENAKPRVCIACANRL